MGVEAAMYQQSVITSGWRIRSSEPHRGRMTASALRDIVRDSHADWREVGEFPAQIHDILRTLGEIPDPWLPGGVEASGWVSERDWYYVCDCDLSTLSWGIGSEAGILCDLELRGVDTVADIYLDGKHIASHANQYLPCSVRLEDVPGPTVQLVVHLHAILDHAQALDIPASLQGRVTPVQMLRKMSNEFCDYLGPKPCFTRVGLYGPVVFSITDQLFVDMVDIGSSLDADLRSGTIDLHIEGRVVQRVGDDKPGSSMVLCVHVQPDTWETGNGSCSPEIIVPIELGDTKSGGSMTWTVDIDLEIDEPELWWPRGFGEQNLYTVTIVPSVQDDEADEVMPIMPVIERSVGFRHISHDGDLHFRVNGKTIQLLGAAMAPFDLTTLVPDKVRPRMLRLLDHAENAHMNCLRVWSEIGPMEDEFYEECDRRGFLLWQDFLTNGALPDTPEYLDAFTAEAEYLVTRLRSHASILLWCGGNENLMWHFRNGVKDLYHQARTSGPYPGWKVLHDTFAKVCRMHDPERPYIISTPHGGRFPNDPTEGTTHGYSHVWYVPGSAVPNLTAEDTRTCPYEERSLRRFMRAEDIWPEGYQDVRTYGHRYPYPETWVDYTANESWRKVGPVERFYDAHDLDSLIYRIGAANEAYYCGVIDRSRTVTREQLQVGEQGLPFNGGYLYWRLNDAWPMHFSAKIDHFLEPTRSSYATRPSYAPVRVTVDESDRIRILVANNTPEEVRGTLTAELFDTERNEVIRRTERAIRIGAGLSSCLLQADEFGMFRRDHVLAVYLVDDVGQPLDTVVRLFDNERSLTFPEAKLTLRQQGDSLFITTDRYARCVILEGHGGSEVADGEMGWMFEDNFFDLMPGDERCVRFDPQGKGAGAAITGRAFYSPHTTRVQLEPIG